MIVSPRYHSISKDINSANFKFFLVNFKALQAPSSTTPMTLNALVDVVIIIHRISLVCLPGSENARCSFFGVIGAWKDAIVEDKTYDA